MDPTSGRGPTRSRTASSASAPPHRWSQTLQEYVEQAVRTDAIIAGLDLDDRSASPFRSGEHPTLRWVILHLIEENARHNGHLDILRELADGATGD